MTILWVSLLGDSPVDVCKPPKVYRKFYLELLNDFKGVVNRFSDLWDELVTSIHHDDLGPQRDKFIISFRDTPIFREYHRFYRTGDHTILKYLSSFLLLGKKMTYSDSDLDANSLRDWLEVEHRIGQIEDSEDLIRALRHIVYSIFEDFTPLPFLPVHGSGAVAQPGIRDVVKKNELLSRSDLRFQRLLRWSGIDHTDLIPWVCEDEIVLESTRTAQLQFVPKNFKKTRSICKEPVLLQYAQQGVRLSLEEQLNKSTLTSGHVVLHDQGVNRDGAVFGSEFNTVDTIDLSAASDSVRWSLIKGIFPAKVTKYLAATRSVFTQLPDGSTSIRVKKFAPMGSALCFPVQCVVYSAVVILATIMADEHLDMEDISKVVDVNVASWMKRRTYRSFNHLTSKYQPYRVYGDDIICDSRITSIVIGLLTSLGFSVNSEKSFMGSQSYRESCGVHAYDGYDVTPLTIKLPKIGRKVSISDVAAIIDVCNEVHRYAYKNLRTHVNRFLAHYSILNVKKTVDNVNPILYTKDEDQSFAILCDSPKNTHLRRRVFDRNRTSEDTRCWYQRDEVRSITGATEESEEVSSKYDGYFYIQWQRSQLYQVENPSIFEDGSDRVVTWGMRAQWRWTPTEE
jgi:hypothetical protein